MKKLVILCFIGFFPLAFLCGQHLNLPESVEYDPYNNRYLVSNWGTGNLVQIDSLGNQRIWLANVNCFAGLHRVDSILYVACREYGVKGFNLLTGENVLDVDIPGTSNVNDIISDNSGNLYASSPNANLIYKVNISSGQAWIFADENLNVPNGMYFDAEKNRIILVSFRINTSIQQISLTDSTVSLVHTPGLHNFDGITRDAYGNYYISSWYTNSVYKFDAAFSGPPEIFSVHSGDPADIFFDQMNNVLAVPLFYTNQVEFVNGPVAGLIFGAPIVCDGHIAYQEWGDADSIQVANPTSQPIKVYFKHDGTNFLAAFVLQNLEVNEYKIPEVLFDTENDKSADWLQDDWWFHISAQDCEGQGEYDVWDDCAILQPDWVGVPNFGFGTAPPIDTIELLIPWEKINLQNGDTIGLAFDFWVSDELRLYWPSGASVESPATWSTFTISDIINSRLDFHSEKIVESSILPNPFRNSMTINFDASKNLPVIINIFDATGRLIKTLVNKSPQSGLNQVVWDGTDACGKTIPSGPYYCKIQTGEKMITYKIVKL